ncbi:MAG: ShlB/FhaC/HecB family hemolysin secretion/activation protein [Succinivibrio sp.]|nr:ShlB/FhaC/HecB family hemolysin secretion/activation protein [Succinivibrio sp.]
MHTKQILKTAAAAALTACLQAQALELKGVNVTSKAPLSKTLIEESIRPMLGKTIDATLLQQVLDQVNRTYREHGYPTSHAYIPEQVSSNGIIHVAVLSPRLERIELENRAGLKHSAAQRLFKSVLAQKGSAANTDELNSDLLKLQDLGIFTVSGGYTDGRRDDGAVLTLSALQRSRTPFRIFTDNHGTKAAGIWRLGATGAVRNLTGNADTLSWLAAVSDEGQADGALGYSIPLNSHPTVLSAELSAGRYELGDDYEALGARGHSFSGEAALEEPLYRSPALRLSVQGSFRHRILEDRFSAFDLTLKKNEDSGCVKLKGGAFSDSVSSDFSFSLRRGRLSHRDDWYEDESADFTIASFDATLAALINKELSASAALSLQHSADPLEGENRFAGGGATRVAAYRSGLAGDSGAYAGARLEWRPDREFALGPRADFARVSNRGGESASLKDLGVFFEYSGKHFFAGFNLLSTLSPVDGADRASALITFGYQHS